jgi:hypothetical protein
VRLGLRARATPPPPPTIRAVQARARTRTRTRRGPDRPGRWAATLAAAAPLHCRRWKGEAAAAAAPSLSLARGGPAAVAAVWGRERRWVKSTHAGRVAGKVGSLGGSEGATGVLSQLLLLFFLSSSAYASMQRRIVLFVAGDTALPPAFKAHSTSLSLSLEWETPRGKRGTAGHIYGNVFLIYQ